tara:strand:- start:97 stop:474 length:378 start_codon:yes stop_codon:yes gene_type:complete
MKNLWTTIHVKDMDASVKFYTEILDLTVDKRYSPAQGMEIAFLGSGETKFELIRTPESEHVSFTNHVSTGFSVESVDAYIEYLEGKGIEIVEGPFAPNPYVKFFYILDPNGYRIQLVETMTPDGA